MLATILALLSAVAFGAADFVAGLVTRRTPVLTVVVISQLSGLALLLCTVWFVPGTAFPNAGDVGWGLAAGCAGGVGLALLYLGLAIGRMSVVSPLTALLGASLPVVFGIASGERPAALALYGVGLALVSVVLISSAPEHAANPLPPRAARAGIAAGIASGLAIGTFLILLAHVRHEAGLWALAAARCSSIVLLGTIAFATRRPIQPFSAPLRPIVLAGLIDATSTALYVISTRYGLLSVVAVLTSLYPASTVLMARFILKERMTPLALGGMALAAISVSLIALAR
ncbi:MAG TPA: DMT family transporter [Candidatus Tumulicola sp.]|nr:DMT family transporter [Candidatus Tumulicola sp.]